MRKIVLDLAMHKIYLDEYHKAPKGVNVQTGPHGGEFYEIPYSSKPDLTLNTRQDILNDRLEYLKKVKENPDHNSPYYDKSYSGKATHASLPTEIPDHIKALKDPHDIDKLDEYDHWNRYDAPDWMDVASKKDAMKQAHAQYLIDELKKNPNDTEQLMQQIGINDMQGMKLLEGIVSNYTNNINICIENIVDDPKYDKAMPVLERYKESISKYKNIRSVLKPGYTYIKGNDDLNIENRINSIPRNHYKNIVDGITEEMGEIGDLSTSDKTKPITVFATIQGMFNDSSNALSKAISPIIDTISFTDVGEVINNDTGKLLTYQEFNDKIYAATKPVMDAAFKKKPNAKTANSAALFYSEEGFPLDRIKDILKAAPGNDMSRVPDYLKPYVLYMGSNGSIVTCDPKTEEVDFEPISLNDLKFTAIDERWPGAPSDIKEDDFKDEDEGGDETTSDELRYTED